MTKAFSDTLLAAKSLSCGYHGREVLQSISFTLSSGECTALLGTNGSGKSTLLRTLAKMIKPVQGTFEISGKNQDLLSAREIARNVAYVPQFEEHSFDYSVAEVTALGRLPWSSGIFETTEDWEAIQSAMQIADCTDLANRSVIELSGGEKQRVLIARALAQQTRLLLLDEPTSHLDVLHQVQVGKILSSLANEHRGILVAVHDLNWAATFTKRSLLLHNGNIYFDGPTHELLRSPILESVYGVKFDHFENGEAPKVFPSVLLNDSA